MTPWWRLYRLILGAATPVLSLLLARRAKIGKEDPARLGERWGRASLPRPAGALIWLHAASVGEARSLLPLIERLGVARPAASFLVTTGTVTSARLMTDRLPRPRARHQYLPIDHSAAVARFLDHWRPDLAIWVESELWPTLVLETRRRGTAMALVNARMSERSAGGWRRWPGLIGELLGCFDLVLAQDAAQAARLRALGAAADSVGDLKASVPAPPIPPALAALTAHLAGRPVWLAASTHDGEEDVILAADRRLRAEYPALLTVLAPRHPARTARVSALLRDCGLDFLRRSDGSLPEPATAVWLIDTMGELDLFYRLAPIVFVGGSLGPPGGVGGHNPLEAALCGAAVLHGGDMVNCARSAAALDAAGGALAVTDAASLAEAVAMLLAAPERRRSMGEAAQRVAEAGQGVVDAVLDRLDPWLPPAVADRCRPGRRRASA
jgi:3-deoxy-D-manno-octulosonic-acid transferase